MNFVEATAAFVLDILPPEHLPEVALAALESGLDSTSLAVLAGEPARSDPRDLRELFEAAIRELKLPLPSPLEAADILKQHYAVQVAAGRLAPREGARLIVEQVFRAIDHLLPRGAYVGESFGIARLVGIFYDYDDVSPTDADAIAEIDQAIVDECARLAK
ncbi:MAG: hypothetical protein ACKVX7_15115 [Planctomycetota bacterium]